MKFSQKPRAIPPKVTEKSTIKVPVGELRMGMFVSELDRPWLDSPFLFQGFYLQNEQDILDVVKVCEYVYVDMAKTRYAEYAPRAPDGKQRDLSLRHAPRQQQVAFEKELDQAKTIQQGATRLIRSYMEDIKFGQSVDIQLARSAAAECVGSIVRNPDTMLFLTTLRNKDEYTCQHSFNVCVFAITLARFLGCSEKDLEAVGTCGILHDLGKVQVPDEVLNKPGKLSDEEFSLMRNHTMYGRDLLMSGRNVFSGSVDVAYGHHENLDGTGYPRGMQGHQMNLFTKIVSIVDKYDAITSSRVYQESRTHLQAINILHSLAKDAKIDQHMTLAFISALGVFPTGCLVEMSDAEIGLVIGQNPASKLRPRVVIVLGADRQPVPYRFIDLAERLLDDQGQPYDIRQVHRPETLGLDLRAFQPLLLEAVA